MPFDMSDYVDVAQRLVDLFEKYPDASLRGSWQIIDVAGQPHVAYTAECWRSEGDSAPGIGCAWEPIPGKTPYTRGSELQNAETSAWGRAIVAVGASSSKRIASADEVRSARQNAESTHGERPAPPADEPTSTVASTPTAGGLSKNRVQQLRSRASALVADKVPVADHRMARQLPKISEAMSEDEALGWESLLAELENELEQPFVKADA